jgi:hypothetical protein
MQARRKLTVQDRPFRFRMNFPTRHPLYGGGSIAEADVILGLEDPDFWHATHAQPPVNRMGTETRSLTKQGARLITIFSADAAKWLGSAAWWSDHDTGLFGIQVAFGFACCPFAAYMVHAAAQGSRDRLCSVTRDSDNEPWGTPERGAGRGSSTLSWRRSSTPSKQLSAARVLRNTYLVFTLPLVTRSPR